MSAGKADDRGDLGLLTPSLPVRLDDEMPQHRYAWPRSTRCLRFAHLFTPFFAVRSRAGARVMLATLRTTSFKMYAAAAHARNAACDGVAERPARMCYAPSLSTQTGKDIGRGRRRMP